MSDDNQRYPVHQPASEQRGRRWLMLAALVVFILVGVSMIVAFVGVQAQQREAAQAADKATSMARRMKDEYRKLRHDLYAAHMNLAYQDWEDANVRKMRQLLDEYRPADDQEDLRGFEWYYLNRLCHGDRLTLPQAERVVSLAVSDKWIACGCADGSVQVWDSGTGKEAHSSRKHTGEVRGVAFSPDGSQLATGGKDGVVNVWDARRGTLLRQVATGLEEIWCVAFHPDGKHLAVGTGSNPRGSGKDAGKVLLWSDADQKPVFVSEDWRFPVRRLTFNRTGTHLAASTGDRGKGLGLRVWQVTMQPRLVLKEAWWRTGQEADGILGLAWSPDDTTLAGTGGSRKVILWDGATGAELRALVGHQDVATSVAFSPDGKRVASGGWGQMVRVWDVATGEQLANLRGHLSRVIDVAFLADGQLVTAAAALHPQDGVKVWDSAAGQDVPQPTERLHDVQSLAFNQDGKRLVCGCYRDFVGELKVWDTVKGVPVAGWQAHAGRILGVAFSPDGSRIASAGLDGKVRVWDAETGESKHELDGPGRLTECVAFSPDGKWLAGGGATAQGGGELRIWEATTGRLHRSLAAHPQVIGSVAFNRDGTRLATASHGGGIKLWDGNTLAKLVTIDSGSRVNEIAFSPDGAQLASAQGNQMVRLWNTVDGAPVKTIEGHAAPVQSVVFHPDGKRLISKDRRGILKVWDARAGQELLSVSDREPLRGSSKLALSPDGQLLAVSGPWGARLRAWDARPMAGE